MTTTTYHYEVTEAQLDACHRIVNLNTHQVFYQVESATEAGVEYTVIYNPVLKHLTCTCKAGQNGIPCWHKRAALKAAEIYRQERKAEQERDMIELAAEIEAEAREYTVQVDPTSSSLDGVKWEVAPSGRAVPMR
jgi:hypothetical protein